MRAASHTIHQLTPRVLQNARSGKVVVEDLPTGRPHSVVAVIGHWPPADSFRWPPTLEAPRRAEQRLTPCYPYDLTDAQWQVLEPQRGR